MTDVIEIARSRRSKLVAEIARLDDFISTAETLLRLERDPSSDRGWLTEKKSTVPSPEDPANAREDVKTKDEATATAEADPGSLDPASLDAGSLDPSSLDSGSLESAGPSGRNLFAPVSGDDRELLLGADGPADASEEEASLDAAIGQRLRQRRWMMGMTKRQLAEKLGTGVEEIQNFELGLAHIGTGRIWELASALDVPTSYFYEDPAESSAEAEESASGQTKTHAPAREVALARTA